MTLTKQQKLDMIYDVELRLAKEELAELYVKNLNAIENSDKPLRTLQEIVHGRDQYRVEQNQTPPESERAILEEYDRSITLEPEIRMPVNQNDKTLTSEEKELLEQSEIATKTPFKKPGLDSKSEWEFNGIESLAMRENVPKEKSRSGVTVEQMQAFREEYYAGRYDALETLHQQSKDNGYSTEEQLNQFTKDRVESQIRASEILQGMEGQKVDFDLQEQFENAQSMSADNDIGMEL